MDKDSESGISGENSSGTENGKERYKVIYVDDVSTSLISLKRRLAAFHEVYPAGSSKVLFEALLKITPDVILLDINMPDTDGYEVINLLKDDQRYADIPVIFFTSNNDKESVLLGLSLGAVDYIIKPFETISLVECIEKHVAVARAKKNLPNTEEDTKPHILAIDDVVSILKSIKAALRANYIVHTISKPEAVLDFLKLRKPDLILLDYLMPVYNGFELIPKIRELSEHKNTPIIMLTSEGTMTNIKEAISLGACDFIVKPFKDNELNEKVAKYLKTE